MEYEYITANNLENKQKYTYSKFGGDAFLEAYVNSRNDAIDTLALLNTEHTTYSELKHLFGLIEDNLQDNVEIKALVDGYLKSFEVRKRLYQSYDADWKPANEEYQDYNCYIIFAKILEKMYTMTNNLKYLNCLLKVDDTLISLISFMSYSCKLELKGILSKELEFLQKMCSCSGGMT